MFSKKRENIKSVPGTGQIFRKHMPNRILKPDPFQLGKHPF